MLRVQIESTEATNPVILEGSGAHVLPRAEDSVPQLSGMILACNGTVTVEGIAKLPAGAIIVAGARRSRFTTTTESRCAKACAAWAKTGLAARTTGRHARAIAELDLPAGTIRARPTATGLTGGTGTGSVAGTGLAGACTSSRITEAATALAVPGTAQPITVAFGLGKGGVDASQTEDAAKGRCRDGFEGLAA